MNYHGKNYINILWNTRDYTLNGEQKARQFVEAVY